MGPRFRPEHLVVDDALLTRFNGDRLHVVDVPGAPRRWMSGAVYTADGRLVEASRRPWSGDPAAPVSIDPASVVVPPRARRLEGEWRYAGHATRHFGHFVLEVLPTLWGPVTAGAGLLHHRSPRGGPAALRRDGLRDFRLHPWQQELLGLAGYPDVAVRVLRHRPLRVDRLHVVSRPVLLKSWAAPEAVEVWDRVADAAGTPGGETRVLLSRSAFNRTGDSSRPTTADHDWDADLDRLAAAAGFTVVHPERLSVGEQLRLVRGAEVLAGSAGSALHLSAFARPGTRVLEVGDARSPRAPLPAQRMVDAARGHRVGFVPYGDRRALRRALAPTT